MKPSRFLFSARLAAACVATVLLAGFAQAQTAKPKARTEPKADAGPSAMLRVSCSGGDVGAEVRLNGVFKGECPLDLPLPEGSWRLRAEKPEGSEHVRVYETEFRLVAATAKKVEVVLSKPRYTPAAKARVIERLMAPVRARYGATLPHCVDCPGAVPVTGPSPGMATPAITDPEMSRWMQWGKGQLQEVIALNAKGLPLAPPAASIPFPCKAAEEAMRRAASLPSMDEFAQMGGVGSKVWPVQAACDASGQLSGPVDFWAFGFTDYDSNGDFVLAPRLVHLTGRMAAGRLAGEYNSLMVLGARRVLTANRAEQAEADAQLDREATVVASAGDGEPQGRAVRVGLTFNESAREQAMLGGYLRTTLVQVTRPGRTEETGYSGTRLTQRRQLKDGRSHGELTVILEDGTTTTRCYRDGIRTDMNPCNVD